MSIFTFPEVFNPVNANGTVRGPNLAEAHVTIKELMWAAQMALFDGNIYTTRAALYADLAHAANSWALVIGDPTSGYDGLYRKSGASGSGSWSRIGDVPGSGFISGSDTGAGTANAIQVTSPTIPAANGAALISFNIFEVNTSSPVTVSFNGATALTIKDNAGSDVQAGALKAGMIVTGYKSGSTFRLINIFDGEFLLATNVSGTNAIVATTPTPIPATAGAALIALPISITNTSSPVTVAFNGGSALTIKDAYGNDIQAGSLKLGMIAAGYVSGSTFRLSQSFGTQFVTGADSGAGTANAIQVTTATPFSQADGDALIAFSVFEANSASPVTVSFNGGTALTIKTSANGDVVAGGLVAGSFVLGVKIGFTFRLLSDIVNAAVLAAYVAAAEAAQSAAEDAADSIGAYKFNTVAEGIAATIPGGVSHILVGGDAYQRVSFEHPLIGPELVTNGAMAADTNWGKPPTGSIGSGVGTKPSGSGSAGSFTQAVGVDAGTRYLLRYTLPTLTGGGISAFLYGGTNVDDTTYPNAPGVYGVTIVAGAGNNGLGFYAPDSVAFTIDNISLMAFPPNAFQSSDGAWWAPKNPARAFVSVRDYGALGEADDRPVFVRALAATDGPVYVPDGDYILSDLTAVERERLYGPGRLTVNGIFRFINSVPVPPLVSTQYPAPMFGLISRDHQPIGQDGIIGSVGRGPIYTDIKRTGGKGQYGNWLNLYTVSAPCEPNEFDSGTTTWVTHQNMTGGTTFAEWLGVNSPSQSLGQTWTGGGVVGVEINMGNRWADFGLQDDIGSGRTVAGIHIVADWSPSEDGHTATGFPASFGLIFSASINDVRMWTGLFFNQNSIMPGGVMHRHKGGSTEPNAPLYHTKVSGYFDNGIDFSSAVVSGDVFKSFGFNVAGSGHVAAQTFTPSVASSGDGLGLSATSTPAMYAAGFRAAEFTASASAVSWFRLNGGPTGVGPSLTVESTDANAPFRYSTKGIGGHVFLSNNNTQVQFAIDHVASSVNFLRAAGSATGGAVTLTADGSDTNIDLQLTPKGTGNVRFGTFTSNADAAVNGYVTIKDAAGNVRKLATIA